LRKGDTEMKMPNAFKLAGEKWASMTDKEKEPYNKLAEAERVLHEKRMEQRSKLGYFKFEDGTKSTDPNNKNRV
jgi:HMG (high mobility group) box